MEEIDDISKLEELLAAGDSDEDTQVVEKCVKLDKTEFLADVVENEVGTLTNRVKSKRKFIKSRKVDNDKVNNDSVIHAGDTDSSDDEEKRNYLERRYDDYGSQIKKIIENKKPQNYLDYPTKGESSFSKAGTAREANGTKPGVKSDVYSDPVFGMRLINPTVSSAVMAERMQGRDAVSMSRMKRHVAHGDLSKDWVVGGAIVRKSESKESQKGSQYCIWTLSDLKDDIKTVSVFLFKNAYKQLWKTSVGTVVGILNPNVLDKRDDSKDEACLSVDNPERVMVIGTSKDFGHCKSRKKNGDQCTSVVNLNGCQYCVYHVKQEYQKFSNRSDLQGNVSNKGLNDLRNKVFGKDTYIYGGRSFSAVPAAKTKQISGKDKNRLMTLSDHFKISEQEKLFVNKPVIAPKKRAVSQFDTNKSQRLKDLERIKLLQGSNPSESPSTSSQTVKSAPTTPTLKLDSKTNIVDLNFSFGKKHSDRAKLNAIKFIKEHGPLKKVNPHNLRGSTEGKRRVLDQLSTNESEPPVKKPKLSDDFQKMLNAKSAHSDLIEQHEDSEQDRYFNKLEMKEAMEEKMLNTFKVACKAVKCLKCSYTSFSAAERCRQERHPLKVFDTHKRFFKCTNCSNRTVTLDLIPLHPCKNCQSMKWTRAAMINERKCKTLADTLSIRGEEEKFIGSVHSGANINLLVPTD